MLLRNQRKAYPLGIPREVGDEIPTRMDNNDTILANAQSTSDTTCHCEKTCKNLHGLRIHQAKMKCTTEIENIQCLGIIPSETKVEQVPVITMPSITKY